MKKKGFIWVSAVLYIALGVIAISLVLTAGLPLIDKMKDRNTIIQTKELMHAIDRNILQVVNEGMGSKRVLPIIVKGGKLHIFEENDGNKISWETKTKAKIMEPCEDAESTDCFKDKEGNLKIYLLETVAEGEYMAYINLEYSEIKIELGGDYKSGSSLIGKYTLSMENYGSSKVKINIL